MRSACGWGWPNERGGGPQARPAGEPESRASRPRPRRAGNTVSATAERQRFARIALSFVAEPGDLVLGGLLRCCEPAEIMAALSSGDDPGTVLPAAAREIPGLTQAVRRWRARLDQVPLPARLSAWEGIGLRQVCPGEPEWPARLDDLGEARPMVLWLRGNADLRHACLRSVSVVGSRASTGYGNHVCAEMAAALAERGWAVISGGSKGLDSPETLTQALAKPQRAQERC
jgi:DNA processing protein